MKNIKNTLLFISAIILVVFLFASVFSGCTAKKISETTSALSEAETEVSETNKDISGEIIVLDTIFRDKENIIGNDKIKVDIAEDSIIQDDIIKISKYNNLMDDDENLLFSEEAYGITLSKTSFFDKPVQITIKYDESLIPDGISEQSIVAVFSDENGTVYLQGGEIDTENNTITINTFHASNWFVGIIKEGLKIAKDEVVKLSFYQDFQKEKAELFANVCDLFEKEVPPEFSSIEKAKDEVASRGLDYYGAIQDLISEQEEFIIAGPGPENLADFPDWLNDKLFGWEFYPEKAFEAGVGAAETLFGESRIVKAFGKANTVFMVIDFVNLKIMYDEAAFSLSKIANKYFAMKKAQERYEQAKLILALMEDKEIYNNYLKNTEKNGIKVSEESKNNFEKIIAEGDELPGSKQENIYEPITSYTLSVIFGPEKKGDMCVYRVQANITGDYKSIIWNRDDSNGNWGSKVTQVDLKYGENFILSARIIDYEGKEYLVNIELKNPFEPESEPTDTPEQTTPTTGGY